MPVWQRGRADRSHVYRMGCGSSVANEEDPLKVVVFGALGMVGGAVANALIRNRKVKVIAVTRNPTSDRARELAEQGAVIGTADLNDPRSVERVLDGADAVFLTTHYWEHLSKDKEITQGMNAVDGAVKGNVRHLVLHGAQANPDDDEECGYFESKTKIEEYVISKEIPYTILRMPFFYENLLSIFKPHKLAETKYALPLPLEDATVDAMSVRDMGRCVMHILLRPKTYLNTTVNLAAERLTAHHMADSLTRHIDRHTFVAPAIRVQDYAEFTFTGAKDLAAVFQYYRNVDTPGDIRLTKKMCGSPASFDRWVNDNRHKLMEAIADEESAM